MTRLMAFVVIVMAGCAPSEEEIQREFDDYVADARGCEQDADCAVASSECPLGCWVVVRRDRVDDVERKAQDLVEDWESGDRRCDYECAESPTPVCRESVCTAE